MNRIDRLYRILFAALLWLPLATPAQDADASAEPRAEAAAEDPAAVMLGVARALKEQQPALFGDAEGVLVTEVLPDTQGAAAGLVPDDVLIGYDEAPLSSTEQLIELTSKVGEDRSVVLRFLRDGRVREVSIHGGRIGVAIRNVAQTVLDRMIELNQAGQQADDQARYAEAL